jgi:translocation and assembly module TamA
MFSARPDQQQGDAPARPRILAQIVLSVNALCSLGGRAQEQPALPKDKQEQKQEQKEPAAPLPMDAPSRAIDYSVRIDAPRNLRELLEDNLDLMRWRGNPRLDIEQLQRLVRSRPKQVKTLIATEGYYTPTVTATSTVRRKPVARVVVEPGQPVLVGDVDIELRGFVPFDKGSAPIDAAALRQPLDPAGRRALPQADWEAAKRGLLRQITQSRFPRAQLLESSATVDPDTHRALLKVVIDSGPDARFGA